MCRTLLFCFLNSHISLLTNECLPDKPHRFQGTCRCKRLTYPANTRYMDLSHDKNSNMNRQKTNVYGTKNNSIVFSWVIFLIPHKRQSSQTEVCKNLKDWRSKTELSLWEEPGLRAKTQHWRV